MSTNLRQKIQQLNRLNTENVDYAYIKSLIKEMHKRSSTIILNSGLSNYLYRVRINPPTKPNCTSELREPSAHYVSGFQRCNIPEQPMFYSANRRITAILECNPVVDDVLYLGQWRVDKRFAFNSIFRPELLGDIKLNQYDERLIDYYDTVFTRHIHSTYSSQYKITAAITDKLTKRYPPGNDDGFEISELGNVALSYPSVVDIEDGHNMVLYPEMVDECLNLAHVMEAQVISRSGNKVSIEITDNSNVINNGVITWSGDPTAVPLDSEGKSTIYVSDGNTWRLGVRSESMGERELDNFLCE